MTTGVRPIIVAAALLVAGCSGDDETGSNTTPAATDTPTSTAAAPATTPPEAAATTAAAPATTSAAPTTPPSAAAPSTTAAPRPAPAEVTDAIEAASGTGCDPTDPRLCALPYPSNAATVAADTPTGRTVSFGPESLPANAAGTPIDPTEWNRNDGFSPNSTLLTSIEHLDTDASELPSWTDLGASLNDDATIALIELSSGERVPLWAEPDVQASNDDATLLAIHPAVALRPATDYAIAIRGLVDTDGEPIDPSPAFRAYRDGLTTDNEAFESRRADMEAMFAGLGSAGIERDDLQLAWMFTTISDVNLTSRMLTIRDRTLAELGDTAPAYTIDTVTEPADDPELDEANIARQITGTFTVTNWLTGDGSPGQRFNWVDGALEPNGTVEAPFICEISDTTMDNTEPAALAQYGHGLLGNETEIQAGNVRAMANEHNIVHCATKWAGMSADDVPNAVAVLGEVSLFPTMADRLQQGVLNQIILGRLMSHPDGFAADPAFTRPDGTPLVDPTRLHYDGNSQGGIMGLMLAAVSPDFERAVLGVPGMNYSLLLPRSVDFDDYEQIMEPAYPDPTERRLIVSVLQMLWDRGEGAGYAHHVVANPFPNTPPKRILMQVAYGDHQVSELAALVQARTLGIDIHRPVGAEGRMQMTEPGWGLDTAVDGESESAIVFWDSGAPAVPFEETPPRDGDDSHEDPRADPNARRQKAAFLLDGVYRNVCGDGPCLTDYQQSP